MFLPLLEQINSAAIKKHFGFFKTGALRHTDIWKNRHSFCCTKQKQVTDGMRE